MYIYEYDENLQGSYEELQEMELVPIKCNTWFIHVAYINRIDVIYSGRREEREQKKE